MNKVVATVVTMHLEEMIGYLMRIPRELLIKPLGACTFTFSGEAFLVMVVLEDLHHKFPLKLLAAWMDTVEAA